MTITYKDGIGYETREDGTLGYEVDDGTMPENVTKLDGRKVVLSNTDDCCAYTALDGLVEHLPTTDHVITAVKADQDFERWHIIADLGEVLELQVGWSSGNPFCYGYGFDIDVVDAG